MTNHHNSMQILNKFVPKYFRPQKGTAPNKTFKLFFERYQINYSKSGLFH